RRIGVVVEWADVTEAERFEREREKAAGENLRIRAALDNCRTNVMVADENFDIVYMNNTMSEMIRNAETDLRQALPQLDSRRLVGSSIDIFHKNPAHQRRMLEMLSSTYHTDLEIAGRNFRLVVNPVLETGPSTNATFLNGIVTIDEQMIALLNLHELCTDEGGLAADPVANAAMEA
ncbi:MAG: PAS domain-containing protein, partial [Pseudomonadota bacterium]